MILPVVIGLLLLVVGVYSAEVKGALFFPREAIAVFDDPKYVEEMGNNPTMIVATPNDEHLSKGAVFQKLTTIRWDFIRLNCGRTTPLYLGRDRLLKLKVSVSAGPDLIPQIYNIEEHVIDCDTRSPMGSHLLKIKPNGSNFFFLITYSCTLGPKSEFADIILQMDHGLLHGLDSAIDKRLMASWVDVKYDLTKAYNFYKGDVEKTLRTMIMSERGVTDVRYKLLIQEAIASHKLERFDN